MTADGMPSALVEPIEQGRRFSSPAARVLVAHRVRRPDTLQFRSIEGTCRMAGVPSHRLRRLIAKEATDNALDACDRAGRPGMASIDSDTAFDVDRYTVTDQGGGIEGDPVALADLFSTERAMLSGKYWRMPTRGVLGNGLRVLCAAVALSEGTITVESRGRRTVLRPRRIGPTEIVERTLSDVATGTRITYTLADTIPADAYDLADAQRAIWIAQHAGPPYARHASPHWIDADHLVEVFATIEPADTTVRQLIEQLDGCTGAMAGKLAAPFGKGRTCRSMSESDTATLLRSLHNAARAVRPHHLGPIGRDAFGDAFDAYMTAETRLLVGGREPFAITPVLIEAWASVTSRKGGNAGLRVFCNRSPVVGGASATRAFGSRIALSGAGLDNVSFPAEGGDCDLILSVQAPLIPTTSLGKAAHLFRIGVPIEDALRRAFVRSRNRLPIDPVEPKPPKHEPPPKPKKPPPYEPTGPLALHLAVEAEAEGIKPADLLVLSPGRDPFNETKATRRDAEWFAAMVRRFKPTGIIHLRGMYYIVLASGDVLLPNGARFVGNADTAQLIEDAGKYARHLGLVPFDRIVDERAAPPEYFDTDGDRAGPDDVQERKLTVQEGNRASVPEVSSMLPTVGATEAEIPCQPYRICMIGEKTSLGPVLRPIAHEVHAELLLETGEISESHAYGIARRAASDGRPLRILYFADFDPAGWQMSVSLARKLQAHIVREFADLDVRLIRVALTFEQVQEFKLPDSPIKEGEKRAEAWEAHWGRKQVEIDALAALRPDLLDRIARDAVAPYFDPTLERRFNEANTPPDAEWLDNLPTYREAEKTIAEAHSEAQKAIDTLNTKATEAHDAVRKAIDDAEDKPDLPPVEIKPEVPEEPDGAVFDSRDTFVDATRKLQRIKREYMGDDDTDDTPPQSPPLRRRSQRSLPRRPPDT
jgi:hypothetical protein